MKKHLVIGMLAHVDAGKTTLSEGMLYETKTTRSLGRVDNGDAFLDTYALEQKRGITIFSKQAEMSLGDMDITLLDTPGHVDFSGEMERTLQVLDYAILVISGADGVQGHTLTLWRLLEQHKIPVFLFVNKMDQEGTDKERLMKQLESQLDERCVCFSYHDFGAEFEKKSSENSIRKTDDVLKKDTNEFPEEFLDAVAMCNEELMESYLETGNVEVHQLQTAIQNRQLFPCFFGSALKMKGVDKFLQGLQTYMVTPAYGKEFGARVFKISRDDQGNRLTYMKITGGTLKNRDIVKGTSQGLGNVHGNGTGSSLEDTKESYTNEVWEEKVNQIRIYSGAGFTSVNEAFPGMICAVTGLHYTLPGQGLGREKENILPLLVPVLTYQVLLPDTQDHRAFLPKLRQLEEEEPLLHVIWNEALSEIQVQVMGEVQIEVLKHLIMERFGISVEFGKGAIVYRETIKNTVIGVGHYEPLRHYSEVHLRLEPGKQGSGLQFDVDCREEVLAKNWQRLVLTHLAEREHKGVLTGFPITDMKITLIAGRSHLKHTEGGDFRQSTYRAVRQGLMEAESVLLEPWYAFAMEVPETNVGRAMTDLEQMCAQFSLAQSQDGNVTGMATLTGVVPVFTIGDYQKQLTVYTKGMGKLSCRFHGYLPCHNSEEVIAAIGYDPLTDVEQPTGSVFCAHGAGFYVPWDQVKDYKHVVSGEEKGNSNSENILYPVPESASKKEEIWIGPDEVDRIVNRAASGNKKAQIDSSKRWGQRYHTGGSLEASKSTSAEYRKPQSPKEKYLLVDGYNIVFAWEDLHDLANANIDGARGKLMDILCNYQAFVQCHVMLVFDAYRVKGHQTEVSDYHNIQVVYTKEAETADQYIEKFAHVNSKDYDITVATSDGLEQVIIRSQGCRLLSAKDLKEELRLVNERIREEYLEQ